MFAGINPKNQNLIFPAAESKSLKVLLSFAVGGLLGDVFLHLLPEAWSSDAGANEGNGTVHDKKTQLKMADIKFVLSFRYRSSITAQRLMGIGRHPYLHNCGENILRLCEPGRKQSTTEMRKHCQLLDAKRQWR